MEILVIRTKEEFYKVTVPDNLPPEKNTITEAEEILHFTLRKPFKTNSYTQYRVIK